MISIVYFYVMRYNLIRYFIYQCFTNQIFQKEATNTTPTKIKAELEQIHQEIEELQLQLSSLPEGKLTVRQNESRFKWFVSSENKNHQIYLPKSQKSLADELAKKKYLTYKLEELMLEKKACTQYLQHFPESTNLGKH